VDDVDSWDARREDILLLRRRSDSTVLGTKATCVLTERAAYKSVRAPLRCSRRNHVWTLFKMSAANPAAPPAPTPPQATSSEPTPAQTSSQGPSTHLTQTNTEALQEPSANPTQSNLEPQPQIGLLQPVLHLAVDPDTNSDTDSAFDANSSSSTSLASSVLHYEYQNGRRYHGFRSGSYLLPNDEQEQDRLDLLHHIFLLVLSGKLYDAPVPASSLKRVLDIGTGTGIWAIVRNVHVRIA
jgi:hypothetical protein